MVEREVAVERVQNRVVGLAQRVLDTKAALVGRTPWASDDQGEVAMAVLDEVARRRGCPSAVIECHRPGLHARRWITVDKDERHVQLTDPGDRWLMVLTGQRQDHAVDSPLHEEAHVRRVERRVALGVGEEKRVPRRAQPRLGTGDDVRKDWVRDVRHDVADRHRLLAAQSGGQDVGAVAELVDRRHDQIAHLRADVGVPGQDA